MEKAVKNIGGEKPKKKMLEFIEYTKQLPTRLSRNYKFDREKANERYAGRLPMRNQKMDFVTITPRAGHGRCMLCNCVGYQSRNDGTHACKKCEHYKTKHED